MKARPAAALTAPTDAAGPPIRDKIAFYGAGWQIHAEGLAGYIAGRERGDTEERWGELVPPYQELAASVSSPA